MNRGKKLTKNTIIIAIGKISTQFISFILLPLYTAILTTKEYGIVDLVNTIVQLVVPIVSLMIEQATFRFLLDCKNTNEKIEVITTSICIILKTNILFLILTIFISIFYQGEYNLYVFFIIVVTSFNNLFLQIARGLDNTKLYSFSNFICVLLIIILNVIFLVIAKIGIVGMLLSTLIGNFICLIMLFIKLDIKNYFNYSLNNKELSKKLIKYSIPLIPNNISLLIMNSSDKFIVSLFLGASMNGILAISHKFSSIYMTIFGIFLLAWQEFVAIHFFDNDKDEYLSKMINKIFSIFSWIAILLIIAIPIVFNLFINNNYSEAYYNIPIYIIAFLFNIIIGLLGAIYVANKKTIEIVKTTTLAAIINVISNILLIKFIGLYAASISTLIGYLIAMAYRIVDTKKYIKITYDYKKILLLLFCLSNSCILYYINNKLYIYISIPFYIIIAIINEKNLIKDLIQFSLKKGGNYENK